MNFEIAPELDELRRSFGRFLDREVRPVEARFGAELAGWRHTDEMHEAALGLRRRAAAEGFYAAHLPEEVGGWGLSALGTSLLVEDAAASGLKFAQYVLGPPNPQGPSPVLLAAHPAVRDRYLPPLMRGDITMCFALTEPDAGSDAQAITTRATPTADGWVLDGTKHYITGADEAAFAVVFAVTDRNLRANGGITAFCVPRESYRVTRVQETLADTHPYEIVFDHTEVPKDHVIGEVGRGFATAMRFLDTGRTYIAAMCVGLAQFCLDTAVDHARTRRAFGQTLAKYQGVTFPLADSKVELESARLLTRLVAYRIDTGGPASLESSMAKLSATETAFRIADRTMQVLGGLGLMRDMPVERIWRMLRVLRIVEGASEIQRIMIARGLGLS